ncbi:MAG: hypothetical protein ACRD2L_07300, partial [Terriglobia bacterium]
SYGVSYTAGSERLASGSGVVAKLKCKGKQSGSASFAINTQTLEIRRRDGTMLPNFVNLLKENITVTVR